MNGRITNYYASGNTALGFVCRFDSSLQNIERLYILRNGLGTGKSDLLRRIGNRFVKQGYDIWFLHSATVNGAVNGLIVPQARLGILDETGPRPIQYEAPVAATIIDFAGVCDSAKLNQVEIDRLRKQIDDTYKLAYAGFAEALAIHDGWEAVYIANMDMGAADRLAEETVERLYGEFARSEYGSAREDHRFLGAATPQGAVDFVPELTAGLKRYLIKGRPGTGKSTILKRIAQAGLQGGFDIEVYHCGFDPNSLDMVIVRELGFAIFDSTAPHEYFPDRDTDEIIDTYARIVKPGTDEAYADSIQDLHSRYSAKMKQSIQRLAEAKAHYDRLVQHYARATDFIKSDMLKKQIEQEVLRTVASV